MSRTLVITGAGGYLGRSLIQRIMDNTDWSVLAVSSSLQPQSSDWEGRVQVFDNSAIESCFQVREDIDTCIHLAFSRRFRSSTEIARSLDYSLKVYRLAAKKGCRIVNMSSVGIYGLSSSFLDENADPAPDSLYSMAKYASEVLLSSVLAGKDIQATNMRLSGVAQSQRVLPVFIENAKTKGVITITGGKQQFSWIDIDDAVDALIALVNYEGNWKKAYNVSLNRVRYSIVELADLVAEEAEERGYARTRTEVNASEDTPICVGWDSGAFTADTGWMPKVSIRETIHKMF